MGAVLKVILTFNTAFLHNKYPLWNIAPAVVASKCHHPRTHCGVSQKDFSDTPFFDCAIHSWVHEGDIGT